MYKMVRDKTDAPPEVDKNARPLIKYFIDFSMIDHMQIWLTGRNGIVSLLIFNYGGEFSAFYTLYGDIIYQLEFE